MDWVKAIACPNGPSKTEHGCAMTYSWGNLFARIVLYCLYRSTVQIVHNAIEIPPATNDHAFTIRSHERVDQMAFHEKKSFPCRWKSFPEQKRFSSATGSFLLPTSAFPWSTRNQVRLEIIVSCHRKFPDAGFAFFPAQEIVSGSE